MEKLFDDPLGKKGPFRLAIDSAFEADRIGRVAAYKDEDEANRYDITHKRLAESDEVSFLNYELTQENRRVVLSKKLSEQAVAGLWASLDTPIPINGETDVTLINPEEARVFLMALGEIASETVITEPPKAAQAAA